MPIDSDIGSETAVSYQSVDEVSALLAQRAGDVSAWTDLAVGVDITAQEAVAITATRRLEQEQYESCKLSTTQALQFPRASFYNRFNGFYYPSTAIPQSVLLAHAELCLQIANKPDLFDDTGLEGFASFSKGDLSLTPRDRAAGKLPAQVARFLRGIRTGSESVVRLQRG